MHFPTILIKPAEPDDLPEMQKLFVDTIRTVCKNDYSKQQIDIWTSSITNTKRWTDKLLTQYFLSAKYQTKLVGYASLENAGYLDFLYVHKDYQRQGIANQLYAAIEAEARKQGATDIRADVSITARPFFEKQGFSAYKTQTLNIQGIDLVNYRMIKTL